MLIIGFYTNCKNSDFLIDFCPKSYFTETFPKRPIDLSKRLGDSVLVEIATPTEPIADTLNDSLVIKQVYQIDTVHLGIIYDNKNKHTTLIDLIDGDTIFFGYVSKYRELFYLTEKKTDSTYWIGALNIDFDSIQGLGMIREQMCDLEDFAKQNSQSNIIQKADTSTGTFVFYADKKLIREIYPNLTKNYPKLKIITDHFDYISNDWKKIESKLSVEKGFKFVQDEIVESVFPNPANEFIEIDFNKLDNYIVQLINSSVRIVTTKKIKDMNLTIPVSDFDTGFYILKIYSPNDNLMETHRIIIK